MIAAIAALCAATKNEGWLVVFAVLIFYPNRLRSLLVMAPILIPVLWLKSLAPPNSFLTGRGVESYWLMATEWHRWVILTQELWNSATGPFLLPLVGCAVMYRPRRLDRATGLVVFVVTGLMASLILSPFEITWQVSTTLNRLLVQILPAFIYLTFRDEVKFKHDATDD